MTRQGKYDYLFGMQVSSIFCNFEVGRFSLATISNISNLKFFLQKLSDVL